MRKGLILAALLVLTAGFTWSVSQQEALMRDGRVVLLELAPVDPRALMMGTS